MNQLLQSAASLLKVPLPSLSSNQTTYLSQLHTAKTLFSTYSKNVVSSPSSDIDISMWIETSIQFNTSLTKANLLFLEQVLSLKTYLVENKLSVADVFLYIVLKKKIDIWKNEKVVHVLRYVKHINVLLHDEPLSLNEDIVPTIFPLNNKVEDEKKVKKGEKNDEKKVEKDVKTEKSKADKSKEKVSTDGAAVAKDEKKEKKEKSKAKPAEESKPAADKEGDDEALDPSKLDLRVGHVVKCWIHPDSDKLLCEEIDLGEGIGIRTIASGIRAHYAPEQLQGRKVVVLANLKERSMAGFKSQGMVMCASNEDHSVVKLLVPPQDVPAGTKIVFPGFEKGEAATPSALAKKKIFEKLLPGLRTTEAGVATWSSIPFMIGDVAVTSEHANGQIS